uniref:Uncharacterized protein n=1 Tax=Arundo donax TaxID=35708 RepID=A0A0A9BW50_ARUDO
MTTSPEDALKASLPARGRKTLSVAAREDCRVLTIDGNDGRSTPS